MKRSSLSSRRSEPTPTPTKCPLLSTLDRQGAPGPPVEYPSFENHCTATAQGDQIILTQQATFCLSAAHRSCPRFLAAAAANPQRTARHQETFSLEPGGFASGSAPFADRSNMAGVDDSLRQSGFDDDAFAEEFDQGLPTREKPAQRQKWGWIGAAMIFVSTLLCGGIFAVYVGWQIANSSYMAVQPGTVDTLSNQPPQPQIYLVVTATSEPAPQAQTQQPHGGTESGVASAAQQPGQSQQFDPENLPQAVTPTPGGATAGTNNDEQNTQEFPVQEGDTGVPPTQGQAGQPPPDQTLATSPNTADDPSLDALQLEIPTRRPTPILDIPASTPMPGAEMQAPALLPTQPMATPMVLFSARDHILQTGECTILTWNVENVRAVYLESTGVDGHGEREVCMRDRTSDYVLTVLYQDGSAHYFTETVEFLAPTPTPTPTFTFTPEPYLTPTWTPIPPTSTPTPDVQYGAHLASQSGNTVQCSAAATCEVDLLVTNTGSAGDNIAVEITNAGAWPAQVCRPDGVCGAPSLLIAGMGPGNTALVRLTVQVPELSDPASQTYALYAVSQGSGKTVGSNSVQIVVEAAP